MGINVTCPRCGTTYFNLDPSLRGSKMRCPNALCRAIFEVRDDSESPPDKSGPEGAGPSPGSAPEDRKKPRPGEEHPEERKHQTGSVGDMIPILSAEQAGEVPPEETAPEPAAPRGDGDGRGGATETVAPPERPREAPSWQQPPPVRGPQTAETEAPAPAAEPSPSAGGASEVGGMVPLLSGEAVEDRIERPPAPKTPSWQEPPPVRAPQAPVEAPPPSPPAAPTPPPSSQVGGMVPLLSGEAVNLQKEPRPSAPSWQEPPPVRAPQMPGSETQVTSAPAGTAVDWRNAPPPPQTAPPVQRGDGAGVAAVPSVPLPPAAPHRRRRRTLVWTLSLLMMGALVIGGLVWMALAGKNRSEDERRQDYLGEYKAGKFDQSATDFQQLQKDFPQSQHLKEYKFLAELSAVRALATGLNRDPQAAFRGLDQFTQDHVDDPLLDPDTKGNYAEDVGKTYLQVAGDLAQQAEANLDKTLLLEVEQAVNQGAKFASKEPTKPLRDQIARIKEAMAKEARRKVVVADLQGLLDRHQKNGYDQALVRIDQAAKVDPDFPDNGQVKDILAKLYDTLRTQVTWTEGPAPGAGQSGERSEPGLLVVTPAVPSGVPLRDNDRVVFALARGVLYALKETTGDLVWATRVGIDAAVLPVRLPATNVAPESVLVVSSLARDRNYLSKRDAATGNALWTLSLSGPCLARPVVIGPRVYVPTYDGKVHAIDLAGGKVLGVFDIGQPLSAGAAYEPGANLLYVPADSRRVFVLDLKDHQNPCPAILESGHPAGSLRGAPIIVSREVLRQNFHLESAVWPDYLVLNQADSLNAMKLRVFGLPIPSQGAPPQPLLETPLKGWSWFPTFNDGEKLAQVTDAGILSLIGIKQVRNQDKDFFIMYPQKAPAGSDLGLSGGRAQLVHADNEDFWVLAQGNLQKMHYDTYRQTLDQVWGQSLALGSPVNTGQVNESARDLFVVSQSLETPMYRVTDVDAAKGTIRWQQQLGLLFLGDPLAMGEDVLITDQRGSLFGFDSRQPPHKLNEQWFTGQQNLGGPLEGSGEVSSYLLPAPGGKAAYEVACAVQGTTLVLRRVEDGQVKFEKTVHLRAPLGGMPAVCSSAKDEFLVVPLANGDLLRQPVTGAEGAYDHWRALQAEENSQGYVVAVGPDEFLTTDGSRGLTRWHWAAGGVPEKGAASELSSRIVAPIIVLPSAKDSTDLLVCAATFDGTLTLLRDDLVFSKESHPWDTVRSWDLKGKITTGPFLRGSRVGCVVDQRRLVWLDAGKEKLLWDYQGRNDLVGQPQQVGDMLVVADLSGLFTGLDPTTGKMLGTYALKANVAPAAAPVGFGSKEALAPLTDGTILLLDLNHLRPQPFSDFNPIW